MNCPLTSHVGSSQLPLKGSAVLFRSSIQPEGVQQSVGIDGLHVLLVQRKGLIELGAQDAR